MLVTEPGLGRSRGRDVSWAQWEAWQHLQQDGPA